MNVLYIKMNSLIVDIVPFEQIKKTIATKIDIRVTDIELFKSATMHVVLYDSNMNLIEVLYIKIDGDDYQKWQGDDSYVIQYVAKKIGSDINRIKPIEAPLETPVEEVPVESPVEVPVEESPVEETPVEEVPVEVPVEESSVEEVPV